MKCLLITSILCMAFLSLTCTKEPYDVTIYFTSPNDVEVKHGGFFKIESTGDSIGMFGYTPNSYSYTLERDDELHGAYWKDTTDTEDTLHFELYVDSEIRINAFLVDRFEGGEFQIPEPGED